MNGKIKQALKLFDHTPGLSAYRAAKMVGINPTGVYDALYLRQGKCPRCRRYLPKNRKVGRPAGFIASRHRPQTYPSPPPLSLNQTERGDLVQDLL